MLICIFNWEAHHDVTLPDIHVRNFLEAPYRSAAVDDRDLQRNIAKGETV